MSSFLTPHADDEVLNSNVQKLESERLKDFVEALELLYIIGNISGRIKFAEKWPEAALYIFGAELIEFDREGAPDREYRAELEEEADLRRMVLLEIADTFEDKSVDKGVLQIEYVQGVLNQLGRPLALHFYANWLVDRFLPPPAPPEQTKPSRAAAPQARPVDPRPASPAVPKDSMDHVRPISVEPEMRSVPKEAELIVDTEGAVPIVAAPEKQESFAPVFGGSKRSGLRIMGISEAGPAKDEDGKNKG